MKTYKRPSEAKPCAFDLTARWCNTHHCYITNEGECMTKAHRDLSIKDRQVICCRLRREIHRDKLRAQARKYRHNRKNKYVPDPSRSRAKVAVYYALSVGKLTKPECCSRCGEKTKLHGHHRDYNKPLDVVWLCSICHGKEHRKVILPCRK